MAVRKKKVAKKKVSLRKAEIIEKPKAKLGRRPVEIDLKKVEEMAGNGLTKEQIANNMGLSISRWHVRENQNEEIREAYKRGKTNGINKVAGWLLDNANKGNVTAQIFYLKAMGGWRENAIIDVKSAGERVLRLSVVGEANNEDDAD